MELLIDCVLRNIFNTRKDLFGENCTFVSFEPDVEDFDWSRGYQSSSQFGRISFKRDGKLQFSDHLVLKLSPPQVYMEGFSTLSFFNETFFYTRIVPFFENSRPITHLFPKYYSSLLQFNLSTDELVIVFENLQASGYVSAKRKSHLNYNHLKLMMRKLGEFHSYSYHARERAPDHFYALTLCLLETNFVVLRKHLETVSVLATRGLDPLLSHPNYGSKIENLGLRNSIKNADKVIINALVGDEQNRTHVLCHGDFLSSNVLFKYENDEPIDMKIVDLATCRFASPVIDLALILYFHADQKMRNENWEKLFEEYYTALCDTFPSTKVPSKDSILMEFKDKALFAYMIASYFLTRLIADDDGLPVADDLLPKKYKGCLFKDIPIEVTQTIFTEEGGERATLALSDILKDMIDRGFI